MIMTEALRSVRTIITHANCADGMASAIILNDALPEADVRFISYDSEEHRNLQPEPGMLFCDFTPFRDRISEFLSANSIVLDHHKGAEDVVQRFALEGRGVFADETKNPGVSGASLAYHHVWRHLCTHRPATDAIRALRFAELVGIYDTWQRSDREWYRACDLTQVLRFMPFTHWSNRSHIFGEENARWWEEAMRLGSLLRQRHNDDVRHVLRRACRDVTPKGTRIVMFQGGKYASDATELDTEDPGDIYVAFDYEGAPRSYAGPRIKLSLRTRGDFDCKAFCLRYGGGGHTKAAGCTLTTGTSAGGHHGPYNAIMTYIEAFEASCMTSAATRIV